MFHKKLTPGVDEVIQTRLQVCLTSETTDSRSNSPLKALGKHTRALLHMTAAAQGNALCTAPNRVINNEVAVSVEFPSRAQLSDELKRVHLSDEI